MIKITVKDQDKDFHVFKGDKIRYRREGSIYDIFTYADDDGQTRRKDLGSFNNPIWVKQEAVQQNNQPARPQQAEEDHDPFTRRDLEQRDPPAPDHNMLARGAPIEGYPEQDKPVTIIYPPVSDGSQSITKTRAAPQGSETKLTAKYIDGITSSLYRPENAKISIPEDLYPAACLGDSVVEILIEAGLLTEEDAPTLDELMESGAVQKGVAEENIPEVDVQEALKVAEKRHQERTEKKAKINAG